MEPIDAPADIDLAPVRPLAIDASPARLPGKVQAAKARLARRVPLRVTVSRVDNRIPIVPVPMPVPAPVLVPRRPWNVLAILALPLAVFLPLVGFITGVVAVRQIRRTGERGAVLGTLGWILGLANTIYGGFVLTVLVLGAAVKYGVEDGVKDGIVGAVIAILQRIFG
jgi:hypothetical protein